MKQPATSSFSSPTAVLEVSTQDTEWMTGRYCWWQLAWQTTHLKQHPHWLHSPWCFLQWFSFLFWSSISPFHPASYSNWPFWYSLLFHLSVSPSSVFTHLPLSFPCPLSPQYSILLIFYTSPFQSSVLKPTSPIPLFSPLPPLPCILLSSSTSLFHSPLPPHYSTLLFHLTIPLSSSTSLFHSHLPPHYSTLLFHLTIPLSSSTSLFHSPLPPHYSTLIFHLTIPLSSSTSLFHSHLPPHYSTLIFHLTIPLSSSTSLFHSPLPPHYSTLLFHLTIPLSSSTSLFHSPLPPHYSTLLFHLIIPLSSPTSLCQCLGIAKHTYGASVNWLPWLQWTVTHWSAWPWPCVRTWAWCIRCHSSVTEKDLLPS